jgi:hypothetical protein
MRRASSGIFGRGAPLVRAPNPPAHDFHTGTSLDGCLGYLAPECATWRHPTTSPPLSPNPSLNHPNHHPNPSLNHPSLHHHPAPSPRRPIDDHRRPPATGPA